METKLYAHQEKFLARNPNVEMLVWGMGSGKTRAACLWAKGRTTALIVCPKGLKENWRRECVKWGFSDFLIVSKEEFKKSAKQYYHRTVIVDEADHFFSAQFKSQLSKALRWYIKENNPSLLLLTGSPYRSSAWNIYTAATFLGHTIPYNRFKYEYFDEIRIGFRTIPVPKKGSDVQLKKLIAEIGDVFRIEDGFDIPPQIDEIVYSYETDEQKTYKRNNPEVLPIVRFTRDHQTESGIGVKVDPKLEILKQYADNTDKVAIVCRYRDQLEAYKAFFVNEGHTVYEIHGGIEDRSGVLDSVEAAEKCVLLLQSATCEGYEAPSIELMVFASLDYSYRNYIQMRARILRMNRLHKNVYVHLICGKSDRAVMDAMINKQDFDVLKHARENDHAGDIEINEERLPF